MNNTTYYICKLKYIRGQEKAHQAGYIVHRYNEDSSAEQFDHDWREPSGDAANFLFVCLVHFCPSQMVCNE